MGTGSVEFRFYSAFSRCRRCLSPFSGGEIGARGKGGQAPSRQRFSAGFTPIEARSQSPFSTHRLQYEYGTLRGLRTIFYFLKGGR